MKQPQDRKPPGDQRRGFDANGRKLERISEYFDFARFPEKRDQRVTREELAAVILRMKHVEQSSSWLHRIKLFMLRPLGSPPAKLAVTQGEKDRGEVSE